MLLSADDPYAFSCYFFFPFCFCLCSRFRALAFHLAGLVILYVSILDRFLVYLCLELHDYMKYQFIRKRKGAEWLPVRKWVRNARSALGLGCVVHTLTDVIYTSHTSGRMSGREW